jgi:stage II sporulation protein M
MTHFYDKAAHIKAAKECIILFGVAILVGIVACLIFAGLAMHFIHQSQTTSSIAVVNVISKSGDTTVHLLALFFNNLVVCLLVMFLPYAVQKAWGKYVIYGTIISFGMLTGAVILVVTSQNNLLYALSALLPHGVPELGAFFLCTGYGIMLFRNPDYLSTAPLREAWNPAARAIITWVIPLVFLAAFIEAYITPILMSLAV